MSETKILGLFKHDDVETNENKFDIEKALNQNWDKIDEYEDKQDEEILKNKKDIENLETKRSKYYSNAITKRIEKIKNAKIYSAGSNLYNQEIDGESSQETREGYNLFNKYGDFSYSYGSATDSTSLQEDGTIITTSRISQLRSKGQLIKNLKSNTDYTVSGIVLSKKERGKDNNFCLIDILPYENTTAIKRTYISNSENLPYKFKFTFNTGENTSIWISLNGMDTSNSESTIPVFDEIMIYEGTIDKEYQEYGAMPSIDFPSKVVSVSGGIDYTIIGENLFNKYGDFRYSSGGGSNSTSLQEDGTIISTAQIAKVRSQGQLIENLKVKTDYTVIGILLSSEKDLVSNIATIEILPYESRYPIVQKKITKEEKLPYNFKFTFNTGNNTSVWISLSGSTTESNKSTNPVFDEIMIYEGTDNKEYDPYKEFNTTIELPEGVELYSVPDDIRDYIDSDGVIHKKINKIEVDSFSRVDYLDKRAVFRITPSNCIAGNNSNFTSLLCTHAIADRTDQLQEEYKYKVSCRYATNSHSFYIYVPLTYFSSTTDTAIILQEMNEILKAEKEKGTPLTFYYLKNEEDTSQKLADSEIEKLQNLKTFLGITNITITAPLSASYNEDINYTLKEKDTRIEKLESRIDELEKLIKTASTSSVLIDNLEGGV